MMQLGGRRDLRTSRLALLRYSAAWLLTGVAVALLLVAGVRLTERSPHPRRTADPLAQVTASGCVLENPRGRPADVSRPPAGGPPSRPVADGLYSSPQHRGRLVGALRRGVVVVQYERGLPRAELELLTRAFAPARPRRVVAPDGSGMPFKVAATAWGRLIGCSKVDARVVAALTRFAQRYAGRGPESPSHAGG
jgi:hypothetical protein